MKAMFAHILLNYDVQLVNGSMEWPANFIIGVNTIPDRKAKVMFRKRGFDSCFRACGRK